MTLDSQNYESQRAARVAHQANATRKLVLPDPHVNGCNERRPLRDSDRKPVYRPSDASLCVIIFVGLISIGGIVGMIVQICKAIKGH